MRHNLLFSKIFNTPLLIHPDKLSAIVYGLGRRIIGEDVEIEIENVNPKAFVTQKSGDIYNPGYLVKDGIAVISIYGVLAHFGGFQADSSYILGYQTIAARLNAAVEDPAVNAIVMVFDSPGGEAQGAFDLAERIRQIDMELKPVFSAVADNALSAGYLLASAGREISVTRTGMTGSVGVVLTHIDMSKALAEDGLKITLIFAGDKKVDGNYYEPLPGNVKAELQAEVDKFYNLFVNAVSINMDLSAEQIIKTQAGVYLGNESLDVGFATRIETPDALIQRLQEIYVVGNSLITTGDPMAADDMNRVDESVKYSEADIEAARAAGVNFERERIQAIFNLPEASNRVDQAKAIAFETDLGADQARVILASAPEENAMKSTEFEKEMLRLGNPNIAPDENNPDGGDDSPQQTASQIINIHRRLGGKR